LFTSFPLFFYSRELSFYSIYADNGNPRLTTPDGILNRWWEKLPEVLSFFPYWFTDKLKKTAIEKIEKKKSNTL
jgi:hypothetical protein